LASLAVWLAALPPSSCTPAEDQKLEKVPDLVESISVISILLVLYPKHSSYWEENYLYPSRKQDGVFSPIPSACCSSRARGQPSWKPPEGFGFVSASESLERTREARWGGQRHHSFHPDPCSGLPLAAAKEITSPTSSEIFLEEFRVQAQKLWRWECVGRLGLRSPALPAGGCPQPLDLQPVFCGEAGMLAASKSLTRGENRERES